MHSSADRQSPPDTFTRYDANAALFRDRVLRDSRTHARSWAHRDLHHGAIGCARPSVGRAANGSRSSRQQPHVGLVVPSQHRALFPEQPHTPLWCEQQPRCSGPSLGSDDAAGEAGSVTARIATMDNVTPISFRIDPLQSGNPSRYARATFSRKPAARSRKPTCDWCGEEASPGVFCSAECAAKSLEANPPALYGECPGCSECSR